MTMYVRALQPITVSVSDKNYPEFVLNQNASKVLPLWVAQKPGFQKLWAANRVQVATDSGFTSVITTIPSSETQTGTTATISIGTVSTGAAGSSASVTNVGTSSAAVLNFSIPRGDAGSGSGGSGSTAWSGLTGVPTALTTGANVANGYAGLDSNAKVPVAQLPNSIMEYQGTWNASTNSPTLANGTGNAGDVYRVTIAASRNLGAGAIDFQVGDYAIYDGSVWQKADTTDAVSSVNGYTGSVTLAKSDVGLGNVDNTSDSGKPVSTAAQTALDLKANAASAALTGTAKVATGGTLELYNTADQATNFEKSVFRYTSNMLEVGHMFGGTGSTRSARFGVGTTAGSNTLQRYIQLSGSAPFISYNWSATSNTGQMMNLGSGNSWLASTGTQIGLGIDPTVSQIGTASYTVLLVNPTDSGSTASGTKLLADFQVAGTSKAKIDNTGSLTANSFIPSKTTTSGTTLTLTKDSPQIQEFTNSAAATLNLPTTGVVAGQSWTVIANGSYYVSVYPSSGGGGLTTVSSSQICVFTARIDSPTANADWLFMSTITTANTIAQRDSNSNLVAKNFIAGATSLATSSTGVTLTIGSNPTYVFTGGTAQTVTLPTLSIIAGQGYTIINSSTAVVTVQSSGPSGGTVFALNPGVAAVFTALQNTPTAAAHWSSLVTSDAAQRITPRIGTTTSSGTISIDCTLYDQYNITALALAITGVTITGTPTDGQKLLVRIKGDATPRTITWGASFTSSGVATLLGTTLASKTHLVGLVYDSAAALWVCMAVDATGY